MKQNIQHIAIVRLSALGDVCHAMAVVSSVQATYPDAKITWVTSPLEANLVRLLDGVDVQVYDKKTGLKGMLALRRSLKGVQFDVLLHLQWSMRASLLTLMLNAKRRIGFARAISREKQHWFVNELAPEPEGMHVLDAFRSVAKAIDVSDITFPVKMNLSEWEINLPAPYVVINPAASKPERNWQTEGYIVLANYLQRQGVNVVLTGGIGAAEIELGKQIENAVDAKLTNLVGKTSIGQMVAVLSGAQFVVSPDTGPAHMATLSGVPVVGLYAHSNPRRTGPYGGLEYVVNVYDPLAQAEYGLPVAQLPWAARVHDPKAMNHITFEMVKEKVDAVRQGHSQPA